MIDLLKKYVKENNIKSLIELKKVSLKSNFLSSNLDAFDFDTEEFRFHGEDIEIKNKILEFEYLKINNSRNIRLINCVIIGSLSITDSGGQIKSIYIDNCIISERLALFGNSKNTSLNDSNIKVLDYCNCNIAESSLSSCSLGHLCFNSVVIDKLYFVYNKIYYLSKYKSRFKDFNTSNDFYNFKSILCRKNTKIFNSIEFVDYTLDYIIDNDTNSVDEKIETIEFLKDSNLLSKSKKLDLIANHELQKVSSENYIEKLLTKIFWSFGKPFLLLFYATFVILFFSCFYYHCGNLKISNEVVNTYWDCLYFSGVTFTTIGYGDIQPVGITRFFAMFEGFIGIILSSALLVSMVNKYSKNN